MTSAHTRSGPSSRPSPDLPAIASDLVRKAERAARDHRQELLLLAATSVFVLVVALIGVAAVSS